MTTTTSCALILAVIGCLGTDVLGIDSGLQEHGGGGAGWGLSPANHRSSHHPRTNVDFSPSLSRPSSHSTYRPRSPPSNLKTGGLLGMARWIGSCFGSAWAAEVGGRPRYVTRDDFASTCAEVEELIPSAAFCSLDLEMTSLKNHAEQGGEQARFNMFDTTEERYQHMREVVLANTVLSVGLCLFHMPNAGGASKRVEEHLVARPYNFLVFPDPVSTPNLTLDMQTLVDFHAEECRFDFNKWIYAGIPFTDAAGEAGLQNIMRAQYGLTAYNKMTRSVLDRPMVQLTAETDLRFMRTALEGLELWLRGQGPQRLSLEYQLPPCNSFLRLALHQTVAIKYPRLRIMMRPREAEMNEARERHGWWLWLFRLGAASGAEDCDVERGKSSWGTSDKVLYVAHEKDARWAAQSEERVRALIRQRIGFRRVFAALSAARRPLVLHNGLYDLLFLMHYFHAPLPSSLELFKAMVQSILGDIYDTKVLAGSPTLSKLVFGHASAGSSLSEVWGAVNIHSAFQTPRVKLPAAFRRYDSKRLHDAGWDALATGEIFAKLSRHVPAEEAASLRGQLYLARSPYSLLLYSSSDEVVQSGAHLVITGLNQSLQTADIHRLFAPLEIRVTWASDERAHVQIPRASEEEAVRVLREPGRADRYLAAGVAILTLRDWQAIRASVQGSASGTGGVPEVGGGGDRRASSDKRNRSPWHSIRPISLRSPGAGGRARAGDVGSGVVRDGRAVSVMYDGGEVKVDADGARGGREVRRMAEIGKGGGGLFVGEGAREGKTMPSGRERGREVEEGSGGDVEDLRVAKRRRQSEEEGEHGQQRADKGGKDAAGIDGNDATGIAGKGAAGIAVGRILEMDAGADQGPAGLGELGGEEEGLGAAWADGVKWGVDGAECGETSVAQEELEGLGDSGVSSGGNVAGMENDRDSSGCGAEVGGRDGEGGREGEAVSGLGVRVPLFGEDSPQAVL